MSEQKQRDAGLLGDLRKLALTHVRLIPACPDRTRYGEWIRKED